MSAAASDADRDGLLAASDRGGLLAAYRDEVRVLRLEAADLVYRAAMAEIAADSMSLVHRWEVGALERALEARERHWWNDERLWFVAGALSVFLMVDVSVVR